MLSKRRVVLLNYAVLSFVLILGVSGVYAARGLHGDGAFYLLSILTQEKFISDEAARQHVLALTQFPAVWAMHLGCQDLKLLIRVHSIGLILLPIAFWFFALALQNGSNRFWLMLIAFSATYLSSGFHANGEYNLTYAMVALCASIILKKSISNWLALVMLVAAFALIRSYEAMVYLGPLLILWLGYVGGMSGTTREWLRWC